MTPHDSSLSSETMCLETVPSLTLELAEWLSLADGIITEVKKQRLAECALRWGLMAHSLWNREASEEKLVKREETSHHSRGQGRGKPSALVCRGYSHKSPQTQWLNTNVLVFIAAGQKSSKCLLGQNQSGGRIMLFFWRLSGRVCLLAHLSWQSSVPCSFRTEVLVFLLTGG